MKTSLHVHGSAIGGNPSSGELMRLYKLMWRRFGFLDWWPGETKEEVFIGAILTQQTTWKNVEKAIANLRKAKLLSVKGLSDADVSEISTHIKPSGYYRQKAMRLKGACSQIIKNYGSLENLFSLETPDLRETLLNIKGIGPETADSITLYAAGKPTFVIDAYTKRIMARAFGTSETASYYELKELFESSLKRDARLYNDFHAQFVELGKNYCKTKPLCADCPVKGMCRYGKRNGA